MAYNFLACDRDQAFLLPPDLRDWLPANHLAWFVRDVVDQLDLGPFLKAYRADGHGRAAYEPRMLLAVLLYAYCTGIRSSRQIERRCHEDIAFRVLAGNSTPDHVTIARFRVRHEQALAGLLVQSLKLCAAAGMVQLGLIALDGTKLEANAAAAANRTHACSRRRSPNCSNRQLPSTGPRTASTAAPAATSCHGRWPAGPNGWPGCSMPRPCWRPRPPPVSSATSSGSPSWPLGRGPAAGDPGAQIRPRRRDEAPNPTATINTTDPDSRFVRGSGRTLQGYNAQAAATLRQVVVAAELTQQANDLQQLAPMLTAIRTTLASAGIDARPQRLAADSGYWSIANVSGIPDAPELLIPPARHGRHGKPRKDGGPAASKSDGLRAVMLARLASQQGKADYAQRSHTIEPVFGQVKTVQGGGRFMRRGLRACQAEWKLLCGTHNLLKLWRTTTATS
jgi:transposase